MPHIPLPEDVPGIQGPLIAYPDTAKPLTELAQTLLQRETPQFSKAERETVAAYVSFLNKCVFCSESHAAVADVHWKKPGTSKQVWENFEGSDVSEKLKSILRIAGKVQSNASSVSPSDIAHARAHGLSDSEIHDTVLIAAAFCMFNRYVDGLATIAPERGHPAYTGMGETLANQGYVRDRSTAKIK